VDDTPNAPAEPVKGARIVAISISNGDTLCDDYIDVQYEKDTTSSATLTLTCNSACNPVVDPVSITIPAMLPSGVEPFHLTHDMTADEKNKTVTATIDQGGANSKSRTVDIKCTMGMKESKDGASREAVAGSEAISLDPAVKRPIRLVRRAETVLLGTYRPDLGDTLLVVVQWVNADGRVIDADEHRAECGKMLTDVVQRWSVRLRPHHPQPYRDLSLNVRLVLLKNGHVAHARTFPALPVCGMG
jgi:hypothetical protein